MHVQVPGATTVALASESMTPHQNPGVLPQWPTLQDGMGGQWVGEATGRGLATGAKPVKNFTRKIGVMDVIMRGWMGFFSLHALATYRVQQQCNSRR